MKTSAIATITVLIVSMLSSTASAQSLYGTNDSQRFFERGNRLIEKEIRVLQENPPQPQLQLGEQPKNLPEPPASQNQQPTTTPSPPSTPVEETK